MGFYVYILRCADESYYTGHTEDLEFRLAEHESGHIPGYTHRCRPVKLVFAEEFSTRIEALESERQIKGWSRAKKEALIARDWESLAGGQSDSEKQRMGKRDCISPFVLSAESRHPVRPEPGVPSPPVRPEHSGAKSKGLTALRSS